MPCIQGKYLSAKQQLIFFTPISMCYDPAIDFILEGMTDVKDRVLKANKVGGAL